MMTPSVTDNPPSRNCDDEDGEDLSVPISAGVIVNNYDSDNESESEDSLNPGYELLPQEPEGETPSSLEEEEDEEVLHAEEEDCYANSEDNPSKVDSGNGEGHSENACGVTRSITSLPDMDQDHVNKIKAAMVGFHLPLTSIPSWAVAVPEEQWKRQLMQRMKMCQGQQESGIVDGRIEQLMVSECDKQQMEL